MARQARHCAARQEQSRTEHAARVAQSKEAFQVSECSGEYLALPTEEERRAHIAAFIDTTGNEVLCRAVCIVCAQELTSHEGWCSQQLH